MGWGCALCAFVVRVVQTVGAFSQHQDEIGGAMGAGVNGSALSTVAIAFLGAAETGTGIESMQGDAGGAGGIVIAVSAIGMAAGTQIRLQVMAISAFVTLQFGLALLAGVGGEEGAELAISSSIHSVGSFTEVAVEGCIAIQAVGEDVSAGFAPTAIQNIGAQA